MGKDLKQHSSVIFKALPKCFMGELWLLFLLRELKDNLLKERIILLPNSTENYFSHYLNIQMFTEVCKIILYFNIYAGNMKCNLENLVIYIHYHTVYVVYISMQISLNRKQYIDQFII